MSDQAQNTPSSKSKLFAALAKAQSEFVQPEKNKEVEVKKDGRLLYTTKYADLKNVIEAFRGPLTKNGLSFSHKTEPVEGKSFWHLVLIVRHESGEFEETRMPIVLEQAPQQVGSALTYLKRYQAAAYFGIAADDDDDANGAHGNQADFRDRDKKPAPAKQQQRAPAAQQKPAAAQKVEDQKQEFPPDDLDQRPPADRVSDAKANDPADFVMPLGSEEVKGKKLKELSESQLKKIRDWAGGELAKVPPVPNMSQVFEVSAKVKAFLGSVGVQ